MSKQSRKLKKINIIILPNTGIFENFLPLIIKLKQKYQDVSFLATFPHRSSDSKKDFTYQFKENHFLLKQLKTYIDEFVFTDGGKNALTFKDFSGLEAFNNIACWLRRKDQQNLIIRIMNKLNLKNFLNTLLLQLAIFLNKKNKVVQNKIFSKIDFFVMDMNYFHDKECPLKSINAGQKIVSIVHGIDLYSEIENKPPEIYTPEFLHLSIGPLDADSYSNKFELPKKNIIKSGILKHEKFFLDFVDNDEINNEKLPKNFILVLSRMCDLYLPPERKYKNLQSIKKFADSKNLKVVFKLHPKEVNEGLIEKVFDKKDFRKSWYVSHKHPFFLANKSLMAITFRSGLSISMIKLRVPCVEMLDLRGMDNLPFVSKDNTGDPVYNYRSKGLVSGAYSSEDLKINMNNFLKNKKKSFLSLERNYEKYFYNSKKGLSKSLEIFD